jgi:hypothetical protein
VSFLKAYCPCTQTQSIKQRHCIANFLFQGWMALAANDHKVTLMIGIYRTTEKTKRQPMMNVFSNASTDSTLATRYFNCFLPGLAPSDTASLRFTAAVARVVLSILVFGLPFGHAKVSAKDFFRMEVRRGPGNTFSAPFTRFDWAIAQSWIWLTFICDITTIQGAVFSRPIAGREYYTAHTANATLRLSEAGSNVTGAVAVPSAFSNTFWRQWCMAVFTVHACNVIRHALFVKIGIERDPKYFDMAVARVQAAMRQQTLELGV